MIINFTTNRKMLPFNLYGKMAMDKRLQFIDSLERVM